MSIQDKVQETVSKLLKLTIKGELFWSRITDTEWLTRGSDDIIEVAYTAHLANNQFALFRAKFRTMDGDERVYWTDRIVLKLIDETGKSIWEFPEHRLLYDLFEKVELKASGVEDRLDTILNL